MLTTGQHIRHKALKEGKKAKKLLAIRLQATGDVTIAMPYLYDLRRQLPEGTVIDLLVREEAESIPRSLSIFDSIYTLKGGRNTKLQLLHFLWMWPRLLLGNYDVLLDLQNHNLSKVMRWLLPVKAWTVFDRTSSNYAGKRYEDTINVLQLARVGFRKLDCFRAVNEEALLLKFGLAKDRFYVVINPAGAFENRNWPLDRYIAFCKLWLEKAGRETTFLLIGTEKIKKQAEYIRSKLPDHTIDLTCRTTQQEAFYLLKYVKLMVSDDSGLLHMAYCSGVPSVGILGSTRSDWTDPHLPHTHFFTSSDLPCGDCMLETCRFAEISCLTRVGPEDVLAAALKLTRGI